MEIPAAAVTEAALAYYSSTSGLAYDRMKAALEAAAPHLHTGQITIAEPTLPTKAEGSSEVQYLLVAADRLRRNSYIGGSGVREMVANILVNAAGALKYRELGQ